MIKCDSVTGDVSPVTFFNVTRDLTPLSHLWGGEYYGKI